MTAANGMGKISEIIDLVNSLNNISKTHPNNSNQILKYYNNDLQITIVIADTVTDSCIEVCNDLILIA